MNLLSAGAYVLQKLQAVGYSPVIQYFPITTWTLVGIHQRLSLRPLYEKLIPAEEIVCFVYDTMCLFRSVLSGTPTLQQIAPISATYTYNNDFGIFINSVGANNLTASVSAGIFTFRRFHSLSTKNIHQTHFSLFLLILSFELRLSRQ